MTAPSVPTVDISKLLQESSEEERKAVHDQLDEALKLYGACYVSSVDVDNGIPREHEYQRIVEAERQFFALSNEKKHELVAYEPRMSQYSGYPVGCVAQDDQDKFERLTISNQVADQLPEEWQHQVFPGPKEWFDCIPGFRETMTDVWSRCIRAATAILLSFTKGIEAAGLDAKDLLEKQSKCVGGIELAYYPLGMPTGTTQFHPHRDIAAFNLTRGTQAGLHVIMRDGTDVACPPRPNCFVVILGIGAKIFTNGRYEPPYHYVKNDSGQERINIVHFSDLDPTLPFPHHPQYTYGDILNDFPTGLDAMDYEAPFKKWNELLFGSDSAAAAASDL